MARRSSERASQRLSVPTDAAEQASVSGTTRRMALLETEAEQSKWNQDTQGSVRDLLANSEAREIHGVKMRASLAADTYRAQTLQSITDSAGAHEHSSTYLHSDEPHGSATSSYTVNDGASTAGPSAGLAQTSVMSIGTTILRRVPCKSMLHILCLRPAGMLPEPCTPS